MRNRISTAAVVVATLALTLFSAGAASAATNAMQSTSPDGASFGVVAAYGSSNVVQVAVHDIAADGNGPTLHWKVGSHAWESKKDGNGNGSVVGANSQWTAPSGTVIKQYICNANTNTGYSSCSSTVTWTAP